LSNTNPNTNPHRDPNTNPYRDPNRDANTNPYRDANTNPNTNSHNNANHSGPHNRVTHHGSILDGISHGSPDRHAFCQSYGIANRKSHNSHTYCQPDDVANGKSHNRLAHKFANPGADVWLQWKLPHMSSPAATDSQ
jgi:hypothetical protein